MSEPWGRIVPPSIPKRTRITKRPTWQQLMEWYPDETEATGEEADFELAQNRLLRVVALLESVATPKEMHKRAVLRVRCAPCGGRLVAWVAWLDGMPVVVSEQKPGTSRMSVNVLDDSRFYSQPTAWCQDREVLLDRGDLMSMVPGPGSPARDLPVWH